MIGRFRVAELTPINEGAKRIVLETLYTQGDWVGAKNPERIVLLSTGGNLKVGDILELQPGTLPVAQAVRPAPPKVPPPVPLPKPKAEQSFSDIKPGA